MRCGSRAWSTATASANPVPAGCPTVSDAGIVPETDACDVHAPSGVYPHPFDHSTRSPARDPSKVVVNQSSTSV
jgi:hypothetical protein